MARNSRGKQSRQLRIIGGKWGSQRFQFPNVTGIRPTSDKMRETLFNWLQFDIKNAHCLDLFAGSGALGLEALSRGAAQVCFVESHHKTAQAIHAHLTLLQCTNAKVQRQTAQVFIQKNSQAFDVIFIDPPFDSGLLHSTLPRLLASESIHPDTVFFIETEQKEFPFPETLQPLKANQSGQSYSWLATQKTTPVP